MLEYQIVLRLVKHFLFKFVALFRKYFNMSFLFLFFLFDSYLSFFFPLKKPAIFGYKICFPLTNLIKKCVHKPKKFALSVLDNILCGYIGFLEFALLLFFLFRIKKIVAFTYLTNSFLKKRNFTYLKILVFNFTFNFDSTLIDRDSK